MRRKNRRRLLLDESVSLCTGNGCPQGYRDTCYRYQLHRFFDRVARRTDDRVFFFISPACIITSNNKAFCRNHREILYINKPR